MSYALLSQAITVGLNQLLKLEADLPVFLQPLQGHSLCAQITDWSLNILVVAHAQGFDVHVNTDNQAEVTLAAPLLDWLALLRSDHATEILSRQTFDISGDTAVLQAFDLFAKQLNLDWEQTLAMLIGNVPAHLMTQPFRQIQQCLKQQDHLLREDIRDYLQQESRLLPCREELEDFFADIQTLRQDIDRLERQIQLK